MLYPEIDAETVQGQEGLKPGKPNKLKDMVAQSPKLVGIVGGSCAGKTWLAERLQTILEEEATRVSLDDFYRDRGHLSFRQRTLVNFDHPRAIDWERVEEVLKRLASGNVAVVPKYDFHTHGRTSVQPTVAPKSVVIMEGLWLFRRASIRNLFDFKIFIRSSRDWCEEKRLARDIAERGRTAEQVKTQLEKFTFPMFERFVAPQEKWADEVVESPIKEERVRQLADNFFLELLV